MSRFYVFGLLLTAVAALVFHLFFSASASRLHALERHLRDITAVVLTQDRAKLGGAVGLMLAPSARITLEMLPASLPGQTPAKPLTQEFEKADFLSFLDISLYGFKDYRFASSVDAFQLSADKKAAALRLTVDAQAEDTTGMSATGNLRFHLNATCNGDAVFPSLDQAVFEHMSCRVSLRYGLSAANGGDGG